MDIERVLIMTLLATTPPAVVLVVFGCTPGVARVAAALFLIAAMGLLLLTGGASAESVKPEDS
jgi:hypothetical protein